MPLVPRRAKLVLAVITVCAFSVVSALPILAATGIGIGPSRVILDDALRGSEYIRRISILNTGDELTDYSFITEGELASWVGFYMDEALTEPVETLVIQPDSKRAVYLRVAIPEDTPAESYEIVVTVKASKASEAEEGDDTEADEASAGAAVSLLGRLIVEITVTGTQNLSGSLGVIHTFDTEVNYPLTIVVPFQNTGNVKAAPAIGIELLQEDSVLQAITHEETTVDPGNTKLIEVSADTTDLPEGEYVARVSVSLGGEELETKELAFKVLPVGTLTRDGRLESLVAETDARVGLLFKAVATFSNIGQIETPAKFLGEVYRDGALLSTIESDEQLVLPGAMASLAVYYKVEQGGDYLLKGAINYGGKLTDTQEVTFSAVSIGGGASGSGEPAATPAAGCLPQLAVAGAVLAGTVVMQINRRDPSNLG